MLYFKIFNSGDINEIGHYPQTGLRKGYDPRLPNSHWQVKHNEFPDFIPNYELELHPYAVATNYLDGTGDYSGFLVDGAFKKVLEVHKLPPPLFLPD